MSTITALIVGVLVALAVRWIYVLVRRGDRRVRSFWVIPLSILFTAGAIVGQQQNKVNDANNAAVQQGVVTKASAATAFDRCIGMNMQDWVARPEKRPPGATRAEFRVFTVDVCREGKREGTLLDTGEMYPSDALAAAKKVVATHGPYFP